MDKWKEEKKFQGKNTEEENPDLGPGRIIGNKYRICGELGKGGFGSVYLVEDENIGVLYAAKVFEGNMEAFQRELKNLKQVQTKGIPRLIDGFAHEGKQWIVMEYMKGIPLTELKKQKGSLTEKERLQILKEIASRLEYLHSLPIPVIYGDLKPENILLDKNNYVNFVDMGSACRFKEQEEIHLTLPFAAPEQKEGRLMPQSDIYSFGEIGFYLLKGKTSSSYRGKMTRQRLIGLGFTRREAEILERCLKEKPEERYINGRELRKDLESRKGTRERFIPRLMNSIFIVFEMFGIMLTAYAMEQWFYEGIPEGKALYGIGIGCLLIVYLFRKFFYQKRRQLIYRPEAELLLYDTGEVRLGILILVTAFSLFAGRGKDRLWVEVRDSNNIPVLWREGSTYLTGENLTYRISSPGTEISVNGGRFRETSSQTGILPVENWEDGEVMVLQFREAGKGGAGCTLRIQKRDGK